MRGSWANISKNRLIFVVIAVLTFCTVWIGYGLLESAKYEQQAKDKISEYTEYTREKVTQACAASDKIENIKCLDEAFAAKRAFEYNQSDLVAQRQSALWAYIMAAAAVIGIALSVLGVWLVKTTFDETRNANEIAKDSAERQMRAYVTVGGVEINRTAFIHGTVSRPKMEEWQVSVELLNQGDTPAFIKCFGCSLEWQEDDDSHTLVSRAERDVQFLVRSGGSFWVSAKIENEFWQRPKSDQTMYVVGEVTYLNIFGKRCVTTFRHYAKKDDRARRADKIFTHTSMTGNTSE